MQWHWVGKDQQLNYLNTKEIWSFGGPGTTRAYGRSTPQPYIFTMRDFALHDHTNGNNQRIMGIRDAAPTTGNRAQGEFFFNVANRKRHLGCSADASSEPRVERSRAPDAAMPSSLAMTYHDPERDYQSGQMRAASGRAGARDERIELPAVLEAAAAKQLVEAALARRLAAGDQLTVKLPPSRLAMQVGDRFRLQGSAAIWTVRSATIEAMTAIVAAHPAMAGGDTLPADPGRAVIGPDVAIGRSVPLLIEAPGLGEDISDAIKLYLAVSNDGGWKPVPVETMIGEEPLAVVAATPKRLSARRRTY